MSSIISFLSELWGKQQSKSFRFASWGIAIIIFSGYCYYEQQKPIDEIKWNQRIKDKETQKLLNK